MVLHATCKLLCTKLLAVVVILPAHIQCRTNNPTYGWYMMMPRNCPHPGAEEKGVPEPHRTR